MAQHQRRLESWKAIADYLGRDVRTAIRWEKEKSLPVHRAPGDKRAVVFAYSEEIDLWMLSGAALTAEPMQPAGPAQPVEQTASPTKLRAGQRVFLCRLASKWAYGLALLVVGLFWLAWPRASAESPRAEPPLQFSRADYAAEAPRGLVTGDFDGDGRLDLAFTNCAKGTIAVLLGDGFGVFPTRRITQTALTSPERLVAEDFDGDGRLDLAVTSYDGGSEVEVLLGRGDGRFQTHARFDVGGRARWISTGDLNHDGQMDLAVAASFASRIVVLLGNGNGSFREGGRYEAELDVSSLALVDVDRDGFLDVIAADYRMAAGSSVSLYLNDGKGGLLARHSFRAGRGPLGLAVGDFDQDRQIDLVTANFPYEASILFGTPSAKFREPTNFAAGRGNGFVAVADLNRDGRQDLLVLGEHSNTGTLFFGDGRGAFGRSQVLTTASYPDAAVIADFDKDGKPDLAIASIEGDTVSIFLNRTPAAPSALRWWARLLTPASRQQ